jgi:hypothetical protein
MPEVEHNILTGAQLHSSKVVTFTGDPASYVPTEAGILVQCLTAPNAGKLYRTTGTTAGALMSGSAADGQAATVSIGTITTGSAGSNATVTNSGTTSAAVLDFTIPRGDAGAGAFGIRYTFSSSTSSGPGAGLLRLNNASPASATQLYVSETDRNGAAIASLLGTIANGSPIQILDESDPLAFAYYTVTSSTDNGTDRTLAVTHVASNGTLAGGVTLTWGVAGAAGSSATSGFGFKYSFNSTTTSGPAAGQVRLNNAASASATQVFIHETDRNSKAIASLLGLITPGTGLMLVSESDPSLYAYYTVTSSTDNGNDRTLAVAHVASNDTLSGNVTVSIAGGSGGGGGVQSVGTASPLNSVTPAATNSLYLQRTFATPAELYPEREVLWIATGTTSADWRVSMAAPIRRVSTANPNGSVVADMPGQLLVNYTEDTYSNTLTATVYISGAAAVNQTNNKWYAI